MRTKASRFIGSIALLSAISTTAMAAPVTLNYTADNDVVGWWIYSSVGPTETLVTSNTSGTKGTEWPSTASVLLDLAPGNYVVYFEARNFESVLGSPDATPNPPAGNPAAFIATIDGVIGDGAYTSSTWGFFDTTGLASGQNVYKTDPSNGSGDPVVDFGGPPVILLGANGTSPWGTRPGISPFAQFIWGQGSVPGVQAQRGIFAASFTVVPIPAAAWLLASALAGLVGVSRRRSS